MRNHLLSDPVKWKAENCAGVANVPAIGLASRTTGLWNQINVECG